MRLLGTLSLPLLLRCFPILGACRLTQHLQNHESSQRLVGPCGWDKSHLQTLASGQVLAATPPDSKLANLITLHLEALLFCSQRTPASAICHVRQACLNAILCASTTMHTMHAMRLQCRTRLDVPPAMASCAWTRKSEKASTFASVCEGCRRLLNTDYHLQHETGDLGSDCFPVARPCNARFTKVLGSANRLPTNPCMASLGIAEARFEDASALYHSNRLEPTRGAYKHFAIQVLAKLVPSTRLAHGSHNHGLLKSGGSIARRHVGPMLKRGNKNCRIQLHSTQRRWVARLPSIS